MYAKTSLIVAALATGIGFAAPAFVMPALAEMTKMVGGAPMYPSKNIIENAITSKDHTTLVAAVKAAGLIDTLEGAGPFTVFAPTNEAFARLPAGTVDTLLKPVTPNERAFSQLASVTSRLVSLASAPCAAMSRKPRAGGARREARFARSGWGQESSAHAGSLIASKESYFGVSCR